MTKTKQASSARPDGPTEWPLGSAKTYRQLFENSTKAQADGIDQMMMMGKAYLEFMTKRLDRDRSLVADLAAVHGPADAIPVLADFYQTTQNDYMAEFKRLSELFAKGARTATVDMQHQFEDTVGLANTGAFVGRSSSLAV